MKLFSGWNSSATLEIQFLKLELLNSTNQHSNRMPSLCVVNELREIYGYEMWRSYKRSNYHNETIVKISLGQKFSMQLCNLLSSAVPNICSFPLSQYCSSDLALYSSLITPHPYSPQSKSRLYCLFTHNLHFSPMERYHRSYLYSIRCVLLNTYTVSSLSYV